MIKTQRTYPKFVDSFILFIGSIVMHYRADATIFYWCSSSWLQTPL